MGKVKKHRKKTTKSAEEPKTDSNPETSFSNSPLLNPELSNGSTFPGFNIPDDFFDKKRNFDDTKSVRSMKSIKNELGIKKITKKDKIKLRKNVFLKKINISSEFLNAKSKKNKAKKPTEDMKEFKDSLPSLSSLLVSTKEHIKVEQPKTKKGIFKMSKRKKKMMEGVQIYKKLIGNEVFKTNPIGVALENIKQRLEAKNL